MQSQKEPLRLRDSQLDNYGVYGSMFIKRICNGRLFTATNVVINKGE